MRADTVTESRPIALIYVLLCVACWSLIPNLAMKTPGELGSHNLLLWSNVVSSLVLIAATALKSNPDQRRTFSWSALLRLALLSVLGVFGYYALLFSAYADGAEKAGTLIAVQYSWPALTAGLLAVVTRERSGTKAWMGVLLAMVGVAVAVWGSGTSSASDGALLRVALAAMMFAAYSAMSTHYGYEPYSSLAVVFTLAAAMSIGWGLIDDSFKIPEWRHIQLILINGVFVNGVSYVWWYRALHHAPATFLAPWVSMTPVLGTLIVYSKGAPIDVAQQAGIALVASSVLLASLTAQSASRATS